MDVNLPLPLLGGLSPTTFMRRHWQKKPLLIRHAVSDAGALLDRSGLFALAAQQHVESRLVIGAVSASDTWKMRHGPFTRRALPALHRPGWTLLVQGVDLHHEAAHRFLNGFRFVPDARVDDVMVSYASDGGGVGPHFDSYDVFLLQLQGRRRWRIGRQKDLSLREGMPLKILRNFEPDQEFILDPGDMLYLPPKYAHDGVAMGECMTLSVGFHAPARGSLAAELLQRLAQDADEQVGQGLYRDPDQVAVEGAGAIPAQLQAFASNVLERMLHEPLVMQRALGEYLTEPKAQVWFEASPVQVWRDGALRLDRKTRMMYDQHHVFINGEAFRAGGRDAVLMRRLADARCLTLRDLARASAGARDLLLEWGKAGWLHGE
jgi:50S ribosomal protein L16 3-hydroxylase